MESVVTNIASHLPRMAKLHPDRLAIVDPRKEKTGVRPSKTRLTFKQFDRESDRVAAGLEQIGIRRGVRTVLMVQPSLELFILVFALFKAGAVLVMVDPGMGVKNLGKCLAEAEPDAFVGIAKAHIARIVMGWARRTNKINVSVTPLFIPGCISLNTVRNLGKPGQPYAMSRTQPDETAAILFTSGSTGVPKGVVYTHGTFNAQVEMIRTLYRIQPGEIDLPTFPLFALFDPALGMTTIIPDMDATRPASVDPKKITDTVQHFGITNMFGSPALLNRVGRYGAERGIKLPTLKRVISAGAPASPKALERFSTMLSPGVEIHTPYGATESLPVCSIGSDEILNETRTQTETGAGVCVGSPVAGVDLSIIGITDSPLEEWTDTLLTQPGRIGEIVVKSPATTREYINRPESTTLAKIPSKKTTEFYHRMGDLGYTDRQGRVWFCGRKSQRVIIPDQTLFTVPCEGIFNGHRDVFRSALVGIQKNGITRPVLCVELEKETPAADTERIKRELLEIGANHEQTRPITTILFHDSFPVDIRHNAKIFREKLALWAAKKSSSPTLDIMRC